jgi:hypothetical protein
MAWQTVGFKYLISTSNGKNQESMMKNFNKLMTFLIILTIPPLNLLAETAWIIEISGDVKFRRGVEENWNVASKDILLEDIDSIWTGEDGKVTLRLSDNRQFSMSQNAMLDITDLRIIPEDDLFLILMKEKIKKIDNSKGKIPLEIGTVSVVHGASKDSSGLYIETDTLDQQKAVKNGIRALFLQEFYANTIVKVQQFYHYFSLGNECGELHFYVGRSFEMLNQFGQAMEAYEISIEKSKSANCPDPHWGELSGIRLEQLKKRYKTIKDKE